MNETATPSPTPKSVRPLLVSLFETKDILIVGLLVAVYWHAGREIYIGWNLTDSYYSHGFLIPPISLVFLWRDRRNLAALDRSPSAWGYPWVLGALAMMVIGDFLGFKVIAQLSLLPMIAGALLLLHGAPRTKRMWFPIAYLIFMVPIPASLTQSIALKLKLFATECAVQLTSLCTLPVVREGSYVHFGNDQLLVGEVCGGLRSLIALLALGALMAYVSKTRAWARILLLALSGPVAVVTNILRISSLCAVAYFYGSDVAAGKFHDISGILIFVVAFAFFFSVDGLLRRLAPLDSKKEKSS